MQKSTLRWGRFTVVKAFVLFFFAVYPFFNPTYAQTNKTSREERKEQLVLQLKEEITLFLSTLHIKYGQVLQRKQAVENALAPIQAKKKSKKTEMDNQIEQALQVKKAALENKIQRYQKMEDEALKLQSDIDNLFVIIFNSKTKTLNPNQQKQLTIHNKDENDTVIMQKYVSTQTMPSYNQIISTKRADTVYYIILGSFMKKRESEQYLAKIQKQYANAVILGNENTSNMYRVGMGPYATKEEAISKRPTNMRSWISYEPQSQ